MSQPPFRIVARRYPAEIATFLLEKGLPLEQIQKFLGHSKIETTQIYAESSTEMIKAGFQKAFSN